MRSRIALYLFYTNNIFLRCPTLGTAAAMEDGKTSRKRSTKHEGEEERMAGSRPCHAPPPCTPAPDGETGPPKSETVLLRKQADKIR